MAPKAAPARKSVTTTKAIGDENQCDNQAKNIAANIDLSMVTKERKALEERNICLENQLSELTKRLGEVELSKAESEKKASQLENQVKSLKRSKGFNPDLPQDKRFKKEEEENAGSKPKKDGSKPKHAMSSYLYFCNENREQVREEHQRLFGKPAEFVDIQRILSEKWKALAGEADGIGSESNAYLRLPYEKMAAEDSKRYQAEMVIYNKELAKKKEEEAALVLLRAQEEQEMAQELLRQYQEFRMEIREEEDGKKVKDVDPDKPKKGLTAFMYFSGDRRKQIQEIMKKEAPTDATAEGPDYRTAFADLAKRVGEEWRELSAVKKKKYEKLAERDALRYKNEMAEYVGKKTAEEEAMKAEDVEQAAKDKTAAAKLMSEQKQTEEGLKLLKTQKKQEQEQKKQERDEKKEKKAAKEGMPKRPASSYLLFCNENRARVLQEHPEAAFTETTKLLAAAWKEVKEKDKKRLQAQADLLSAEYKEQMKLWKLEHPNEEVLEDEAM
eukprot:CAMPEP_0196573036 /NCGR_PEP_ID=MMETSP1081-20130531/3009_1 /TAXON_ID=36882 /ORGANISM="Pyramimonas amylifera, Strain CCMP720" /LENGTH=499 /DNA_ID=CAMNT_0041890599 /DNA_START=46 /DNA_END=1545 /DNA_ORIENTATION=+